jgi:hypothetical protein
MDTIHCIAILSKQLIICYVSLSENPMSMVQHTDLGIGTSKQVDKVNFIILNHYDMFDSSRDFNLHPPEGKGRRVHRP